MKLIKHLFLIVIIGACQPKASFDILIKNGTIYDGSGNTPYTGDVGIIADTIAAIGTLDADAKLVIDLYRVIIVLLKFDCRKFV